MKKNNKKKLIVLISTFILLLLIHLPLLTKNILTADVLLNNFYYNGYSWEISLGRFGLYIIGLLKGFMSIPLIDLIPSFIITSIITYFLIKLFDIKGSINNIIVILMMVLSPIISTIFIFHYCAIGYLIAFLCGVLSIYVFYKSKNKYIRNIIPIIMIIISLSMYQAYLSLIITTFVLYNIKLILEKKYKYKDVLHYLVLLIIGIVIYFILMKLTQFIFHIDPSSYSGADSIGINTILSIPNKFISSYKLTFEFFFKDTIIKNSYFKNYIYSIILFVLMIIFTIKKIIKNKIKVSNIILITILILLLPVFLNSVIFVVNEAKLQLLMASSYIILPIFIISYNEEKIFKLLLIIVFTILLRNYYIQVESTYKSLNNTFKSYDLVISKSINTKEKYKYMIIGNIDTKTDVNKLNYGYISDLGIFWDEYNLRKLAFVKFVKTYHGVNIEFVDIDTYNNLLERDYDKIINNIDDIIVIDFDNV